jgi:hypothetical protein
MSSDSGSLSGTRSLATKDGVMATMAAAKRPARGVAIRVTSTSTSTTTSAPITALAAWATKT